MLTVTGSPMVPFVDALKTALTADTGVTALISTRLYGGFPRGARTSYPYVVRGRRSMTDGGGAMQLEGGDVSVQIDTWSQANGPYEASNILANVRRVLQRSNPPVKGFALVQGSLHCTLEEVFDEPDPDMPEQQLYHGVQAWTAMVEERL